MKINTIINRYLLKEMLPPFVINLAFFTFIFLMTKILEITNLIVNYRVSLLDVVLMLIYSMPFFLEFIIPMSVMMAVLLTFLRMSGDNEIIALKSGGMSMYRFLPPVFLFCMFGFLLAGFIGIWGMPWGKSSFNRLAIEVAETSVHAGFKERTFNDSFDGVMLYVNRIETKSRELIDVFIEEKKSAGNVNTVISPRGLLYKEKDKHIFHLRLFDGMINQVDLQNRTVRTINFDEYEINLDLKQEITGGTEREKRIEEMNLGELKKFTETAVTKNARYYTALMKYYEKFSVPAACFALGLLAMPLGMQSKTERRSLGVVTGMTLFFIYYIMLSVGWSFGESGVYPPIIGMWAPNIVMTAIGLYLFIRTAKDRPVRIDFISYGMKRLLYRFTGKSIFA
ncbi:MAG: LPS export ABC transporter permease LptF [Desulfobacterales bacterium]